MNNKSNSISQAVLFSFLIFTAFMSVANANVSMTNLFTNSMVLQRNMPIPVWGSASNGEAVTVSLNGQSKSTAAASDGKWNVTFNPMVEGGPYTLSIKGSNTINITDVYIGEVWHCAGQSNMDTRLNYYPHYKTIQDSYNNKLLRFYTMRQSSANKDGFTTNQVWKQCINSANNGSLSCLAFFFGKEILAALDNKIAVGLVVSAVGGTKIAQWLDPATIKANSNIAKEDASITPGALYDAWIAPVAGMAMAGTIFMQGENDRTSGQQVYYEERFKLLINGWRKVWGATDFPFYYVQLANGYGAKQTTPGESATDMIVREGQRLALSLPNTAMVVGIDFCKSGDSIHFSNKELAGKRLSLIPRARHYGETSLVYKYPMYESMNIIGGKISIKFRDIGGGLVTNDNKAPSSFAVAGSDKKWYWATTSEISGDTVKLTCTNVASPMYVRYAFASNPSVNLYNKEGLPACPFTTEGNQIPVYVVRKKADPAGTKHLLSFPDADCRYVNIIGRKFGTLEQAASQVILMKRFNYISNKAVFCNESKR